MAAYILFHIPILIGLLVAIIVLINTADRG